jgi:hypothetical protein
MRSSSAFQSHGGLKLSKSHLEAFAFVPPGNFSKADGLALGDADRSS